MVDFKVKFPQSLPVKRAGLAGGMRSVGQQAIFWLLPWDIIEDHLFVFINIAEVEVKNRPAYLDYSLLVPTDYRFLPASQLVAFQP